MKNTFQTLASLVLIAALAACQTSTPTPPGARDGVPPARIEAQASPICGTAGGTVIKFTPTQIATAQTPGRQLIGLVANGRDGLLIVVDDAPGLPFSSVDVELDVDAGAGVPQKRLEFWTTCRTTPVMWIEAWPLGGFGVGAICPPLTAANNFRGCSQPGKTRLFRNVPFGLRIDEFWFREPGGLFNTLHDAFVIDFSFWRAFGGRSVRFIWMAD